MNAIFDPDSWIMQFISRFSSLVVLNLLFLCTSLPLFTLGASLTALYDVVFRMDTDREGRMIPTYFRSFSANFRQGTCIWLIFAVLIGVSCANAVIFSNMAGTAGRILSGAAVVILINALLVLGYVFPLLSQFDNTTRNTLRNALLLAVANLPRTLVIAAVNCFPWALIFMHLYAFIRISFLWIALYFAAAAYFNSRVLLKVFQPLKEQSAR